MVERQLPKLHTRVRFPSPAHLPMKNGLFWPSEARSQNEKSDIVQNRRSILRQPPFAYGIRQSEADLSLTWGLNSADAAHLTATIAPASRYRVKTAASGTATI
jgi:hypothetical protein